MLFQHGGMMMLFSMARRCFSARRDDAFQHGEMMLFSMAGICFSAWRDDDAFQHGEAWGKRAALHSYGGGSS
jgi:hypothetical protein